MVTCFLTTGESETGKQRSDRLLLELLSNADRNYINNLRRRQRCCHKSVFDSIAAFMNDSVACGKNPLTQMGVGMSPVGIGAHIAELLKYSSTHSFCSSCGRIMGPIDMISVATEDNGMQCYHCSGYPSTGGMFRALGFNNGPGHGFENVFGRQGFGNCSHSPNLFPMLAGRSPLDLALPGAPGGVPMFGMGSSDMVELMQRRMWEHRRMEADRLRIQALHNQEELKQRRWVEANWKQLAPLQGLLGGLGVLGDLGGLASSGGLGALDGLGGPGRPEGLGGFGDLIDLGRFGGEKGIPLGISRQQQMAPPTKSKDLADMEYSYHHGPHHSSRFGLDMPFRKKWRGNRRHPEYASSELDDDVVFPTPGRRRKMYRWTNDCTGRNSVFDSLDGSDSSSEESYSNHDHHHKSGLRQRQAPRHRKRHYRDSSEVDFRVGAQKMQGFGIPADFGFHMLPRRPGPLKQSSPEKKRHSD